VEAVAAPETEDDDDAIPAALAALMHQSDKSGKQQACYFDCSVL
jgi:hypothetical protein